MPPDSLNRWAGLTTRLFHLCLGALVLIVSMLLIWRPLDANQDFWAHAAIGRWIWQTGHVPSQSLFLWTSSQPWVYHSWLSQVTFFGLTNVGGPEIFPKVVLVLTAVLALAPFALACWMWTWGGRVSSWMLIPVLVAIQALSIRFQARPELFSEVLLALLVTFLVAWSRAPALDSTGRLSRRDKIGALVMLAMFVVWANFHGGVMLGLVILGVTAVCDLIQDRFNRRSQVLALTALLAPLMVLINPYGLAYFQALQSIGGVSFAYLVEWMPPGQGPRPLPAEMILGLQVLIPLASVAWLLNPRRRLAHLGWLLAMGALFAQARRNIWPLTVVSMLVLAANAASLDPEALWKRLSSLGQGEAGGQPLPGLLRWSGRLVVLCWLLLQFRLILIDFQPWRSLVPARLEQGVVSCILQNQLTGRIFNDYENSSYLQWRMAGSPPLYIDLLNAYPGQLMEDYQSVLRMDQSGRKLFESLEIGVVALTTERPSIPSLAPLADYLDNSRRWARVYAGKDGAVWVRRSPEYEHVWRRLDNMVSKTKFKTLERWNDGNLVSPPSSPEDIGGIDHH
jgi:hypothetical protein